MTISNLVPFDQEAAGRDRALLILGRIDLRLLHLKRVERFVPQLSRMKEIVDAPQMVATRSDWNTLFLFGNRGKNERRPPFGEQPTDEIIRMQALPDRDNRSGMLIVNAWRHCPVIKAVG